MTFSFERRRDRLAGFRSPDSRGTVAGGCQEPFTVRTEPLARYSVAMFNFRDRDCPGTILKQTR
jgi:hypothetical protein